MGDPIKLLVLEKSIDVINDQDLVGKATATGLYLRSGLKKLERLHPDVLSATRGRGLFCAVDFRDAAFRDKVLAAILNKGEFIFISFL